MNESIKQASSRRPYGGRKFLGVHLLIGILSKELCLPRRAEGALLALGIMFPVCSKGWYSRGNVVRNAERDARRMREAREYAAAGSTFCFAHDQVW